MLDNTITFTVFGIPQTKGSAKAFYKKGMRFPVITNDNAKEKPWAQTVSAMAQQYAPHHGPWAGPVKVTLVFRMPIPKSLPKRMPSFMTKRPDIDKCTRSCLDSLKGVVYGDDSQVVGLEIYKIYHQQPGVIVRAEQIDLNFEGAVSYAYRPYESSHGLNQPPQKELSL